MACHLLDCTLNGADLFAVGAGGYALKFDQVFKRVDNGGVGHAATLAYPANSHAPFNPVGAAGRWLAGGLVFEHFMQQIQHDR